VLTDAAGQPQPVTAAPELTTVAGRRVILVGTGRLLGFEDLGQTTPTHAFYAIADDDRELDLPGARGSLVQQVFIRGGRPELTANPVDFSTQRGWYFDLPTGEHANTEPSVAYGAVAFVTNRAGRTDCAQESYLFVVNVATGAKPGSEPAVAPPTVSRPSFFGVMSAPNTTLVSTTISTTATTSRVTALRTRDGRIVGTARRSDGTVFRQDLLPGAGLQPSKNAWREIRR
jgi:type IV pilus assembly protein PilY1